MHLKTGVYSSMILGWEVLSKLPTMIGLAHIVSVRYKSLTSTASSSSNLTDPR